MGVIIRSTKQRLKLSEARILVYLSKIEPRFRFIKAVSNRLDMDYPCTHSLMQRMHAKRWLKKEEGPIKHYYSIVVLV